MHPLIKIRETLDIKKSTVAKAIGIDRSSYGRIEERLEKGECGTTPENADAIAKFFHNAVTRDQILFPQDYMEKAS